ncbi:hypothetical protein CFter6_0395 [Collimonas fungivorans]|uniref:Uncharacterized protein n=1 Tax=Collimonas fungivorans TaxID=158899 RepID=A0A127P5L0_9BURK|nr:hypothetical protein CFter6_0395 [Collimonas fungivorans]
MTSINHARHIRDCCMQAGLARRVVYYVSAVTAVASLVAAGWLPVFSD